MIRSYLICIFLCAPFFINAQTEKADSLFARGEYLKSRIEYERLLYLGHADNRILLKKSYCLKAEGKYEEAYNTLQRADFFTGSDSLKLKLYYESALTAYLAGKYDLSLNKVLELNYYLPDFSQPLAEILEILNLNQQHKLADAKKKYEAFCAKYNIREPNVYLNKKFRKLKDPVKAESISHFLPGVGQMYAGHFVRGATSGLVQAGLLAFTAVSFLNGYYFSGAFSGMGLFYMFNNGGARHAQYLAEKRNDKTIEELNNEVRRVGAMAVKK
ncbi:hypothetical protein WSM22_23760 [Cytophagales bacterium WSM2-2]|nr:hypothetical protein WSM22_23760 [Cytophagales bacterium WSM2-2]